MTILVIWLVLSASVAAFADSRGRNSAGWFVLGVITTPVIAALVLALMPDLKRDAALKEQHAQLIAAVKGETYVPPPVDPRSKLGSVERFSLSMPRPLILGAIAIIVIAALASGDHDKHKADVDQHPASIQNQAAGEQ